MLNLSWERNIKALHAGAGEMVCLENLGACPCVPWAQGLFPGHSFQGWGVGCGRKPWLCFPRASRKTNSDFFSLSSFAFVSSQLLPLNLPFPQRVLLSSHPFILSPSSLASFPLSPAPVHAREEDCPLKRLFSAVITRTHLPPTHHNRRAAFHSLPLVGPDRFRALVQITKDAFALDSEMPWD